MLHNASFFWQSISPEVMPDIAHIGPNCIRVESGTWIFFDTKTIWPGQIIKSLIHAQNAISVIMLAWKLLFPELSQAAWGTKLEKYAIVCLTGELIPLAFSYSTIIIPFKIILLLTLPKPNAEVSLKLLNGKRPGEIYQGIHLHPCTRCNMIPTKLAKNYTKPLIPKSIHQNMDTQASPGGDPPGTTSKKLIQIIGPDNPTC